MQNVRKSMHKAWMNINFNSSLITFMASSKVKNVHSMFIDVMRDWVSDKSLVIKRIKGKMLRKWSEKSSKDACNSLNWPLPVQCQILKIFTFIVDLKLTITVSSVSVDQDRLKFMKWKVLKLQVNHLQHTHVVIVEEGANWWINHR